MSIALIMTLLFATTHEHSAAADPITPATPLSPPYTWVTADDYPPAALRAGLEGTTAMRFTVDTSGRVTGCTVSATSGSAMLDHAACDLMELNGRYAPARNAGGNLVKSNMTLRFTWRIPRDSDNAGSVMHDVTVADRSEEPLARAALPPIRPFTFVLEMDVSPEGKVQNCHPSFMAGLPTQMGELCRMMEGSRVTPLPIGEPQVTGKHLVFRTSMSVEGTAASPEPRAAPPIN